MSAHAAHVWFALPLLQAPLLPAPIALPAHTATCRPLPVAPPPAVLEGGSVLEKAAANISVVAGVLTHERAKAMSSRARGGIDPAGGQSYSGACGAVCKGLVGDRRWPIRIDEELPSIA